MENRTSDMLWDSRIEATNAQLGEMSARYLTMTNSIATVFIDGGIRPPRESDLGECMADPVGRIADCVDDLLANSRIAEDAVFRDLLPGQKVGDDAIERGLLAQEVLGRHATAVLADFIRDAHAEMYALAEDAREAYETDEYAVYFEIVGLVHVREPEDRWALLTTEWND